MGNAKLVDPIELLEQEPRGHHGDEHPAAIQDLASDRARYDRRLRPDAPLRRLVAQVSVRSTALELCPGRLDQVAERGRRAAGCAASIAKERTKLGHVRITLESTQESEIRRKDADRAHRSASGRAGPTS